MLELDFKELYYAIGREENCMIDEKKIGIDYYVSRLKNFTVDMYCCCMM